MAYQEHIPIQALQPIVQQPAQIDNVFSITPGEQIRQVYECDESMCGCGPKYTVTLTDARIIQRFQDYVCGCQGNHVDSMLFLSDISSIKDRREGQPLCSTGCGLSSLCLCILFPIGILCCLCSCNKDAATPITLKGSFGTEEFMLSRQNLSHALANIPAAALPHKVSSRSHYP